MDSLPRSDVGHVLGLLEILLDEDGVMDAYKLQTEEHLSLDDILAIIATAKSFGFVEIKNGDIMLTDLGRRFASADLQTRKKLLREVLEHHPVFEKILSVLRGVEEGCIDREEFDRLIGGDLTEEEEDIISKNILDWGRFAELIWYDGDEDEVCLETEEDEIDDR